MRTTAQVRKDFEHQVDDHTQLSLREIETEMAIDSRELLEEIRDQLNALNISSSRPISPGA